MPVDDPNTQNANNPHAQHPPQGVNDGATGGADQMDAVDTETNLGDADAPQDAGIPATIPLTE